MTSYFSTTLLAVVQRSSTIYRDMSENPYEFLNNIFIISYLVFTCEAGVPLMPMDFKVAIKAIVNGFIGMLASNVSTTTRMHC